MSTFNVVADFGTVATKKDNEFVVVQHVSTGRGEWREARVNYVDRSSGDLKGTKSALMFDDVDDLTTLIEALEEMRDAWLNDGQAAPAPAAPQIQVRKPKNISARAKAVAQKGKAANA